MSGRGRMPHARRARARMNIAKLSSPGFSEKHILLSTVAPIHLKGVGAGFSRPRRDKARPGVGRRYRQIYCPGTVFGTFQRLLARSDDH